MSDYQTLDLSPLCNIGPEVFGGERKPPVGERTYHGLPFRVGAETADGPHFLGVGSSGGLSAGPVTVAINGTARRVIFAHALLESKLGEGGPLGLAVAHYVFRYADGEAVRAPIRERFEVAEVPTGWGQSAFLAVPDRKDGLPSRYRGHWT